MANVNITQAAKLAGISRSYFHRKYIKTGAVSVISDANGKPQVETSELLRVFGTLKGSQVHSVPVYMGAPSNTQENNLAENEDSALFIENKALRQQLQESKEREKKSEEREAWYQLQITKEKLRAESAEVKLLEHMAPVQVGSKEPYPDKKAVLKELTESKYWWQFWR